MTGLSHDEVGDGPKTVVLVHGILGSGQNLKSLAKRLVEADPRFQAILVDLRGHGESHGLPPPHTVEACAQDVAAVVDGAGRAPDALVGHSFGGKVVLALARARPEVRVVAALDSPPGPRTGFLVKNGRLEEVARVLQVVRAVPMPAPSRRDFAARLQEAGLSHGLAQWMTTNLKPVDGGFGWKLDFAVVDELLKSYGALDLWPAIEHEIRARVVVVRGGRSDRWAPDERARLQGAVDEGLLDDHVVEGAGHWLHTDAPDAVAALLVDALRSVP